MTYNVLLCVHCTSYSTISACSIAPTNKNFHTFLISCTIELSTSSNSSTHISHLKWDWLWDLITLSYYTTSTFWRLSVRDGNTNTSCTDTFEVENCALYLPPRPQGHTHNGFSYLPHSVASLPSLAVVPPPSPPGAYPTFLTCPALRFAPFTGIFFYPPGTFPREPCL